MGSAKPIRDARGGSGQSGAVARSAALRARIQELKAEAGEQEGAVKPTCSAGQLHTSSSLKIRRLAFGHPRHSVVGRRFGFSVARRAVPQESGQGEGKPSSFPSVGTVGIYWPTERFRQLLQRTPVWLISAVLHALLLVTLALLTYAPRESSRDVIVADMRQPREAVRMLRDDLEIGLPEQLSEEPLWKPRPRPSLSLPLDMSGSLASSAAVSEFDYDSLLAEPFAPRLELAQAPQVKEREEAGGAQFFGIQADGNRFVFIVDSSTSMTPKFVDAKRELEEAVRRLDSEQMFYVVFFDRRAKRLHLGSWDESGMRFLPEPMPEPDMVPATDENVDAMVYWMNAIQLDSETNPFQAMVFAIRQLQPDAIFLLSDGELRDGGATESFLLRENLVKDPEGQLVPRVIIHCVGFYSRVGEVTLKRIAATHGGSYRFVEPPLGWWPGGPAFFGRRGPRR